MLLTNNYASPMQYNLYMYCEGDPINGIDSNGHYGIKRKDIIKALEWVQGFSAGVSIGALAFAGTAAVSGGTITIGTFGAGAPAGIVCEVSAVGCLEVSVAASAVSIVAGGASIALSANGGSDGNNSIKNQINDIKSKYPDQLIDEGWNDVTDPRMSEKTDSMELVNPKTGLRIRFDKGTEGASGYEGVDHYHVYNNNYTNKKIDFYYDINGNLVGKGASASHIIIGR